MDVRFAAQDLQQTCNRRAAMVRRWGPKRAAIVAERLHELEAVESLADLLLLPHLRLSADALRGRASLEGADGVRMGLRWDAEQVESTDEHALWSGITAVVVQGIVIGGSEEGRGMSHG